MFLTDGSRVSSACSAPTARIGQDRDDGGIFVEFSAEADCVLVPGNRYRIVDLRVGKFGIESAERFLQALRTMKPES